MYENNITRLANFEWVVNFTGLIKLRQIVNNCSSKFFRDRKNNWKNKKNKKMRNEKRKNYIEQKCPSTGKVCYLKSRQFKAFELCNWVNAGNFVTIVARLVVKWKTLTVIYLVQFDDGLSYDRTYNNDYCSHAISSLFLHFQIKFTVYRWLLCIYSLFKNRFAVISHQPTDPMSHFVWLTNLKLVD